MILTLLCCVRVSVAKNIERFVHSNTYNVQARADRILIAIVKCYQSAITFQSHSYAINRRTSNRASISETTDVNDDHNQNQLHIGAVSAPTHSTAISSLLIGNHGCHAGSRPRQPAGGGSGLDDQRDGHERPSRSFRTVSGLDTVIGSSPANSCLFSLQIHVQNAVKSVGQFILSRKFALDAVGRPIARPGTSFR